MELLDRYLQAVKKHLPWQRQDDIIAELRANLESQLDDAEAELGRPLTAAEAEAWLRRLGSPVQVAAQYQRQHYLIGPGLFPIYMFVLRMALMWTVIIYCTVSGIVLVLEPLSASTVIGTLLRIPSILLQVAAWITLAFAVFEFASVRYPVQFQSLAQCGSSWSPSQLPAVESAPATRVKRRSYVQAVAEVVFSFVFLLWLLLVPKHPFLMFGPGAAILGASPFRLASIWMTFYWWIVGLNLAQVIVRCVDLGRWPRRLGRPANMVIQLVGLFPIVLLVTTAEHAYVFLRRPSVDTERYGVALASANHWIHTALLVIGTIVVLQLAGETIRWAVLEWRRRAAAR
jgi:hypothetical protein